MNNKYLSIILIFIFSVFLFSWSKHFNKVKTNDFGSLTKYDIFTSKLKQLEMERVRRILDLKLSEGEITTTNQEAKLMLFKTLAMPLQSVCKILKRVGGQWKGGQRKQVDGDKFVCLDLILDKDSCLIYSFGVARDWTFEDQMDNIGCSVFSYDHTVSHPAQRGRNIKFFKTGLGIGDHLQTLKNLIKANHHETTTIDYLKIDIEGYEFSEGGFQDWISSGALNFVSQIALELHMQDRPNDKRQYINILRILQDLYSLGFRIISQEVNMVKGPDSKGFYSLLEVVFMKEKKHYWTV